MQGNCELKFIGTLIYGVFYGFGFCNCQKNYIFNWQINGAF